MVVSSSSRSCEKNRTRRDAREEPKGLGPSPGSAPGSLGSPARPRHPGGRPGQSPHQPRCPAPSAAAHQRQLCRSRCANFLVLRNTLPCSRPVRIQVIWKKNRDLLAQSIQDSPNDTDFQYSLNSNQVCELDETRAASTTSVTCPVNHYY